MALDRFLHSAFSDKIDRYRVVFKRARDLQSGQEPVPLIRKVYPDLPEVDDEVRQKFFKFESGEIDHEVLIDKDHEEVLNLMS